MCKLYHWASVEYRPAPNLNSFSQILCCRLTYFENSLRPLSLPWSQSVSVSQSGSQSISHTNSQSLTHQSVGHPTSQSIQPLTLNSLVHSPPFVLPFIHSHSFGSPIRSFARPFVRSLARSLSRPFVRPFIRGGSLRPKNSEASERQRDTAK